MANDSFRHDLSILTRDYHLLSIPIDQQPDVLIDWTTAMLIFDLNAKLDINVVRNKVGIVIPVHMLRRATPCS